MKIAIMGIRGIPANYGGFETFIENLAPRLVARGHQVTVYGRSNIIQHDDALYRGVHLRILPTISHKYFDTVAHTLLCTLAGFFTRYDVVFICNSANAAFAWIPRLMGKPTVLNVDGLEWKRQKWNRAGKLFYRISEFLATWTASALVSDAREVQRYYLEKFKTESTFIPYGAPEEPVTTRVELDRLGLEPRGYLLYVSRMEPENNAHRVIAAFEKVNTDKKLVMVGDAPYASDYIARLRQTRDPRILFTGYIFGQGYHELQAHAFCYIQATEVGGTHPALLEGMGHGNCVVANDVPEHREVLADAGVYFQADRPESLQERLQHLLDHPQETDGYRRVVRRRVQRHYSWDAVTTDYEKLFEKVARKRR